MTRETIYLKVKFSEENSPSSITSLSWIHINLVQSVRPLVGKMENGGLFLERIGQ
jgi:hypothetical protein